MDSRVDPHYFDVVDIYFNKVVRQEKEGARSYLFYKLIVGFPLLLAVEIERDCVSEFLFGHASNVAKKEKALRRRPSFGLPTNPSHRIMLETNLEESFVMSQGRERYGRCL